MSFSSTFALSTAYTRLPCRGVDKTRHVCFDMFRRLLLQVVPRCGKHGF